MQDRSGRNVALLCLVTAAMVLGGFPSVVAYTFLTAAAYVAVRLVQLDWGRPGRMVGGAAMMAGGIGLGVVLAAAQVLPFLRQLDQAFVGDRSQLGEFETLGSLVTMLVPDAYGTAADGWHGPRNPIESISYAGVAVVLLAVVGLVFGLMNRRLRWVAAALLGGAVFWGIAMYAGGPLLLALQELPVFATNRIGRARSVLGFLVAVLAAIGVESLIRAGRPAAGRAGRRLVAALVWCAAAAAAAGLVDHGVGVAAEGGVDEAAYRDAVTFAGLLLAAALVAVLLARWGRGAWRSVGLVALPALVVGQAVMFVVPFWPQVERDDFYPETATHRFLAESLGPRPVRLHQGRDDAGHERRVRAARAQRPRVHADRVRRPHAGDRPGRFRRRDALRT